MSQSLRHDLHRLFNTTQNIFDKNHLLRMNTCRSCSDCAENPNMEYSDANTSPRLFNIWVTFALAELILTHVLRFVPSSLHWSAEELAKDTKKMLGFKRKDASKFGPALHVADSAAANYEELVSKVRFASVPPQVAHQQLEGT